MTIHKTFDYTRVYFDTNYIAPLFTVGCDSAGLKCSITRCLAFGAHKKARVVT